jgi:hypothetical protein
MTEAVAIIEDHLFVFPPTVDAGTYAAVFAGARQFTYEDKNTKEDVTLISWAFLVGEGEDAVTVEGVSSLLLTPRSKGFAWLRAIAPDVAAARTAVKASELIGRPCTIVVEDKDGDARIADVLPAMKP